jgi:DNA-binding response OmpR family regulator
MTEKHMKGDIHSATQALRIVVVEDIEEVRRLLVMGLTAFGHQVREAVDGQAMDALLAEAPADVVVLDIGLPGEDGMTIARRLRQACKCGIVMVTSYGRVNDRVQSFENGADLFFSKPVDIRELDAALRSLAGRIFGPPSSSWRFNSLASKLHTPQGIEVPLSAQEFILMRKLMEIPGESVSRKDIFAALGQPDDQYADRRLETLVSRLRAKVRALDPENELPVRSRHNLGYAFLAEADYTDGSSQ